MGDIEADLRSLAAAERLVRPSGLSLNHVAALDLLARHDSLSSGDIAKELGLSPATVTRCTDKLVAFHMIRASLDPGDLRRNLFRLEGRGRGVLFEIRKSMSSDGSLDAALGLHRAILQAAGTEAVVLPKAGKTPSEDIGKTLPCAAFPSGTAESPSSNAACAPSLNARPLDCPPARLSPAAVRTMLGLSAGSCTVGELARRTGLGQSGVSTALAALRAALLAAPDATPAGDGRERRYALTAQGLAAADALIAGARGK